MFEEIKKVTKDSSLYLIARLIPASVGFIMLPIYTLYLSPNDYGLVGLVLSFQAILPVILGLRIDYSLSRFFFEYKNDELKILISTLFYSILFICLISFNLLYFNIEHIVMFIFQVVLNKHVILFKIGLITSVFLLGNAFLISLLICRQESSKLMKAQLIIFSIGLIISVVEIIILERGAYGLLEAAMLTNFVSCIILFFLNSHYFVLRFNIKYLKEPIIFALPVIPQFCAVYMYQFSDRIIMDKYVTISLIGLYVFSDKIGSILKMIVGEFGNAYAPYFFKALKENEQTALRNSKIIFEIFAYFIVMIIVFISLFSLEIFLILFEESFYDAWYLVSIFCLAYFFKLLYNFSSIGLLYMKKSGTIALITIIAGIINIILNIIFIPTYGITAAALSTLTSFILTFLIAEFLVTNNFKINLIDKNFILILSYTIFVVVFGYWFNEKIHQFTIIHYIAKIFILLMGVYVGYYTDILNKLTNIFLRRNRTSFEI